VSIATVKKELNKLDKDQIIDLVLELYNKYKPVKEFLEFYVHPDEKAQFDIYRDKIFYAFYPKRGYTLKLKEAKQAIADFKKLETSNELIAELMLFYAETGVMYTIDYGDIDENFYSSIEKTYCQALDLMKKEKLLNKFEKRTYKVVSDTYGMGWSFHDNLDDLYSSFYS